MNKTVQLIIFIRMHTPSSQLRLVESRQRRWVGGIRDTEDIVHGIVTIPVFHHSLTVRCKVHRLQTFTLLVIYIGSLRAITEFRIDHVTLLVVTYPINNNALTSLFIARQALNLSQHCSDKLPLHRQDRSSSVPGSSCRRHTNCKYTTFIL